MLFKPLSNHPLYKGDDVDHARHTLSSLFTPIILEPCQSEKPFTAEVYGVELSKLAITYLHFGKECLAGPVEPLDFHTVQLTKSGTCVFNNQYDSISGSTQDAVMLSSEQQTLVNHSADNGILCLIIKDQELRNYVLLWLGKDKLQKIDFKLKIDLRNPKVATFISFFETMVAELNRPGGILEMPTALASMEETLISLLLSSLDHNLDDILYSNVNKSGIFQIRKIEEYLEAHATDPIDIQTLANETGYSVSSIFRTFRSHRNYTPMEFLKNIRMRLAHKKLSQTCPGKSVTAIAFECGFSHQGRFSIDYKKKYGESPSETLKKASR